MQRFSPARPAAEGDTPPQPAAEGGGGLAVPRFLPDGRSAHLAQLTYVPRHERCVVLFSRTDDCSSSDETSAKKRRSAPAKPREDGMEPWWLFTHTSWVKSLQDHLARCEGQAAKMDGGHRPSVEFARVNRLMLVAAEKLQKKEREAAEARAEAARARQARVAKRKAEDPELADQKRRQLLTVAAVAEEKSKAKQAFAGIVARAHELVAGGAGFAEAFERAASELGA